MLSSCLLALHPPHKSSFLPFVFLPLSCKEILEAVVNAHLANSGQPRLSSELGWRLVWAGRAGGRAGEQQPLTFRPAWQQRSA
jgi:hypothetical protein